MLVYVGGTQRQRTDRPSRARRQEGLGVTDGDVTGEQHPDAECRGGNLRRRLTSNPDSRSGPTPGPALCERETDR